MRASTTPMLRRGSLARLGVGAPAASLQTPRRLAFASRGMGFASSAESETSGRRLADESILDHLVCPISKYPLRYDPLRGLIICPEIRVAYPIVDGIPMLVPAEGRVLRDDEEA